MMALTLGCYAQHISGEAACTKAKAWLTTKTKTLAKEKAAAKQSTAAKTKHGKAMIANSSELGR